jgi:hypothetical protein
MSSFTRRPYTGSCHCGRIRYLAYIKTPTPAPERAGPGDPAGGPPTGADEYHRATGQTCYKCNCTTCTKLGFWHLRLADSPGDFYVFAPAPGGAEGEGPAAADGPAAAGGDGWGAYRCGPRRVNRWVFCKACGARPFGFRGEWSARPLDEAPAEVRAAAARGAGSGGAVAAWSPRREGWSEGRGRGSYLSVNLTSVDAKQEGFDLRDFTTFRWIRYFDLLNDSYQEADVPFAGGMF